MGEAGAEQEAKCCAGSISRAHTEGWCPYCSKGKLEIIHSVIKHNENLHLLDKVHTQTEQTPLSLPVHFSSVHSPCSYSYCIFVLLTGATASCGAEISHCPLALAWFTRQMHASVMAFKPVLFCPFWSSHSLHIIKGMEGRVVRIAEGVQNRESAFLSSSWSGFWPGFVAGSPEISCVTFQWDAHAKYCSHTHVYHRLSQITSPSDSRKQTLVS